MHPKTADGVDSLQPDVVDAAVQAVRHAVPGLPLGVTTGFWALPDADARLRAVEAWTVLPDFASVNWHEPGSEELAELLLEQGARRRGRHFPRRGGGVVGGVGHRCALHAGDGRTGRPTAISPPPTTCSARCWRRVRRRRCCCTASTKVVGRYWNTPGHAVCRPESAWRTRCGCPTVRPRRTMPTLVAAAVQLLSR